MILLEAISEVIEINDRTIHDELPVHGSTKRVQRLMLPMDDKSVEKPKQNR